jgi:hypothetical protein
MSNESHKWVLSWGLLGMLVDTLTPRPTLAIPVTGIVAEFSVCDSDSRLTS